MFFADFKNKSDGEKRVTAIVFALIITLLIIGCYIFYRKAFPEDNTSKVSFFELRQVKELKENLSNVGDIFSENASTTEENFEVTTTTKEIVASSSEEVIK